MRKKKVLKSRWPKEFKDPNCVVLHPQHGLLVYAQDRMSMWTKTNVGTFTGPAVFADSIDAELFIREQAPSLREEVKYVELDTDDSPVATYTHLVRAGLNDHIGHLMLNYPVVSRA